MDIPKDFTTKRLRIRRFTEDDMLDLERLIEDPKVHRFFSSGLVYQVVVLHQIDYIMSQTITSYYVDEDMNSMFAIEEKGSSAFVGFVGFEQRSIDPVLRITYCIRHDRWGKGYATEASSKLLEYVMMELKWERVEAIVHPKNIPSVRIAEKIGMHFEKNFHDTEFLEDQQLFAIDGKSSSKKPSQ
jgi:[ribosomal protein S5]-alanine N-acetyltransferase